MDFHIHPTFCSADYLDTCTPTPGLALRPVTLTLLDFALFRATPTVLKPLVYDNEGGLYEHLLSIGGYDAYAPGMGYLVFREFNEQLRVGNGPARYKLFQNMTSHAPIMLGADCAVLDADPPPLGELRAALHGARAPPRSAAETTQRAKTA